MGTKTSSGSNTAEMNVVMINRVFEMPSSQVWEALTNPEMFKKWWGPNGFTCPYSEMDARVGGKYLNCMRSAEGKDFWSAGKVREMIPGKRLVITDSFSDEKGNIKTAADYGMPGDWPKESLIRFELEEADGATKLVLIHEGIPAEMHDDCVQGWNEAFDKLEESLQE